MAKKNKKVKRKDKDKGIIKSEELLAISKNDIKTYGEEVLLDRAIPDVRDGLKPVHRRSIWAANVDGFRHNTPTRKLARIVGSIMGTYHPHGDAAIADAIVNLTKPHCPNPLFHGQGNFGGIETSAAAPRYIEARLSEYSQKYLLDPIYLACIPMVDNYDGTTKEPLYLPSKLPTLLLIGSEGIAVGCSNLIPSFSIDSVKTIVKKVLKGKPCTAKMCAKTLEFNFAYGGEYAGTKEELLEYYKTGKQTLMFRPTMEVDKNSIVIKSMAPRLKPSKVSLALNKIKYIRTIDNIRSLKTKAYFRLNLSNSHKDQPKKYCNEIQDSLMSSLSCQTYATIRKQNKVHFMKTNIPEIINFWVAWRIKFEQKVCKHLILIEEKEIEKLLWLLWATSHLDEIMAALKTNDPDKYLIMKCGRTPEAAKYILDRQVRSLAKLEVEKIKEQVEKRKAIKKEIKQDLKDKDRLINRIILSI